MLKWEFCLKDQSNTYFQTLSLIKDGFFQEHRFYVLPYLPEKFRDRVVYFPKTSLNNLTDLNQLIYRKHKRELMKLEGDFRRTKTTILPKLRNLFPVIRNINVLLSPALYGPNGLYEINEEIIIKPRFDRNIQEVYKLLVNALVHYNFFKNKSLDKKSRLWIRKQKLTDHYYHQLNLDKLFPETKGTLQILNSSYSAKLACESAGYLKKLRPIKPKLEISKILSNLTRSEREIMNLLYTHKNRIVSFDQVASKIWKSKADEKFSLYAISKTIQRLRGKIRKSGITSSLIHTQRGQGYLLYD